jgi:hypothetical protein
MSVAEKLTAIAEKQQRVYNAGHGAGWDAGMEAGWEHGVQQAYDIFWDAYQNDGTRESYMYAFSGYGWTDELYNPKYPLICKGNNNQMFYASKITDTKVEIDFSNEDSASNKQRIFASATKLKTVRKITVVEHMTYPEWFSSAKSLANITFEGVIGNSINFQDCPLTFDSAISVLRCLKDYNGTADAYKKTITLSEVTKSALEDATVDGCTEGLGAPWDDYLVMIGWSHG